MPFGIVPFRWNWCTARPASSGDVIPPVVSRRLGGGAIPAGLSAGFAREEGYGKGGGGFVVGKSGPAGA